MREDLGAFGNELNYYVVACTLRPSSFGHITNCMIPHADNTAYVLGQIPLMTLQTKGKL